MRAGIVTFADRFGGRSLALHAAKNPSSVGDTTPPTETIAVGPAVQARVNQGRWIADCPTAGCEGAELVQVEQLAFFCCECRNAEWGHDLLPVLAPAEEERQVIEDLLCLRPAVATRNWLPGELVEQLADENAANGIPTTA